MGAEQSALDTFEPSRGAAHPNCHGACPVCNVPAAAGEDKGEQSVTLPPIDQLDQTDNNGWTMCMHAAEGNKKELVRRLLKAGCDSTVRTTRTWGMFESGKTALQIAELTQSRLGIDRAEVIEMLREDENARLEAEAQAEKDAAAGDLDAAARRLAEEEAQKRVEAAQTRKAEAEQRAKLANEQLSALEQQHNRELAERAISVADSPKA